LVMVDYLQQIADFEEELKKTPYNKRTQHHVGLLKAKIARVKEQQEKRSSSKGGGQGFNVRKSGDGTVVLLGYPSVGKSTLLNKLTKANSAVASYAFTTLTVIPGTLDYKNTKIQILDVPGIVKGAASGRGRGKEVLSVIRNADLILILVDVNAPNQYESILKEVYDSDVRINQEKADVRIKKTSMGGIKIGTTLNLTNIDGETIKGIMGEFKMNNADVLIREDITIERFIDVIEGNKIYIPSISVVNKIDLATEAQIKSVKLKLKPDLMISAEKQFHIEELKEEIYRKLNFISIFLKEPGKPADLDVPMIMRNKNTIRDVCNKLHRDFVTRFKFARIWGKSSKFPGQKLRKLDHVLIHGDILELHLK